MEEKQNTERMVDEAVGQTHETPPPDEVREKQNMSPEEAARKNAPSPGVQANMSEKTAASVGERVGGAYSEAGSVQRSITGPAGTSSGFPQSIADRAFSAGQHMAQGRSNGSSDQRFVSIIAAFGLGFITAVLLQRRR